jgi:hypothetical protein
MNVREIEALIQKHMNHNQALLLCVTMTTETAIALEEQNDYQKVSFCFQVLDHYFFWNFFVSCFIKQNSKQM